MHGLAQDLRFAARNLARTPAFTIVVAVTLALGIGANTAIFTIVNAVLLRPLPFEDPDGLAVIWESRHSRPGYHMFASPPNFWDWRESVTQLEDIGAFFTDDFFLAGREETLRVPGARVTAGLFEILRVAPELGRTFVPEDDAPGADRVVLISHGLWQREFGGERSIVGRTVAMDDGVYTVVGVMPEGFDFPPPIDLEGVSRPGRADVWLPIGYDASSSSAPSRSSHFWTVVGRLGPGATHASAETELRTIAARLEQLYPSSNDDWTVLVEPFRQVIVGDVRTALLVLLGAVGAVLLIGCVNVANLMIARATGRQREYAIRAALGAGRGPLLRQALVESQVLAGIGGAAGILLAWWGVGALRLFVPASVPRIDEVSIDPVVLGFALLVTVLTGLLFGLAPAVRALTPDLVKWLRAGDRGGDGGAGHGRLRGTLVVAEVALSLVLLVCASLLFSSFLAIRGQEAGYSVERVLTMRISLPGLTYGDEARRRSAFSELQQRIAALPGVAAAGFARDIPLAADFQGTSLVFDDEPPPAASENRSVNFGVVTPGWFEAMEMPVLEGRTFTSGDDGDAPEVIVVNRELVRRFSPDREPLGRRIAWGGFTWTIVGVVGDARIETLAATPPPAMFFPRAQGAQTMRNMGLVVRATGATEPLVGSVRAEIHDFDRDVAVFDVRTMEDVVAASVAQPRFSATMLLLFATVALILAAVGIYGVISYDVGRRTRELGIRIALGARPGEAQRLVIARGMALAGIGAGLGLLGAVGATRVLRSLLHDVSPTDPRILAGATLILFAVAIAAAWLPARRVSGIDPVQALRVE